jgi:hypothetical protein
VKNNIDHCYIIFDELPGVLVLVGAVVLLGGVAIAIAGRSPEWMWSRTSWGWRGLLGTRETLEEFSFQLTTDDHTPPE